MSQRKAKARAHIKSLPVTPAGDRAAELMTRLEKSRLLEGYTHGEVLTAFIGLGAKAVHDGTHFPPEHCLSVIAKTAQVMMDQEIEHHLLETLWDAEQN